MQTTLKKIIKNGKKTVLLEMLAKLPHKEQLEIHNRLSQWLYKVPTKVFANGVSADRNKEFLQTEFGQYILKESDPSIPIEKVRKALAKAKGSLSQEIIAEREER